VSLPEVVPVGPLVIVGAAGAVRSNPTVIVSTDVRPARLLARARIV
jgi:hypothetical protein